MLKYAVTQGRRAEPPLTDTTACCYTWRYYIYVKGIRRTIVVGCIVFFVGLFGCAGSLGVRQADISEAISLAQLVRIHPSPQRPRLAAVSYKMDPIFYLFVSRTDVRNKCRVTLPLFMSMLPCITAFFVREPPLYICWSTCRRDMIPFFYFRLFSFYFVISCLPDRVYSVFIPISKAGTFVANSIPSPSLHKSQAHLLFFLFPISHATVTCNLREKKNKRTRET